MHCEKELPSIGARKRVYRSLNPACLPAAVVVLVSVVTVVSPRGCECTGLSRSSTTARRQASGPQAFPEALCAPAVDILNEAKLSHSDTVITFYAQCPCLNRKPIAFFQLWIDRAFGAGTFFAILAFIVLQNGECTVYALRKLTYFLDILGRFDALGFVAGDNDEDIEKNATSTSRSSFASASKSIVILEEMEDCKLSLSVLYRPVGVFGLASGLSLVMDVKGSTRDCTLLRHNSASTSRVGRRIPRIAGNLF